MKPTLTLLLLAAVLGGCDLVGDDYDHLAPGTFRFRADGKTYTGTARFYPRRTMPYETPMVFLVDSHNKTIFYIEARALLASGAGSRIEGDAQFRPPARAYLSDSGSATITDTTGGSRVGIFRYEMTDHSELLRSESTTVRGGFNAVSVND